MDAKVLIAPSILSADFGRLAKEVAAVTEAGADLVHVDVMDGRFVPNLTVGPLVVEAVHRATSLPVEAHLMMVEPERHLEAFARAGASIITVHVETCPHLHRTLRQIRDAGARPAVALNPSTPIAAVEEVVADVGMVLVMSVNPGFGGQSFIPSAVDKIARLRRLVARRGLGVDVAVDGGITAKNAAAVATAGANVLVAGTAVFGAADYRRAIEELRRNAAKRHARSGSRERA